MNKHRRYIGDFLTVYVGLALILLILMPIGFSIIVLTSDINIATLTLALMCFICSLVYILYLLKTNKQLFSWCIFSDCSVKVRTLFGSDFLLEYNKCTDIGLGYYKHSVLNSSLGSIVWYIYLSYDRVPKEYTSQINLLKTTDSCIKIGFRKETLCFLMKNLPSTQSKILYNSIMKNKEARERFSCLLEC